MFEVVLQRPGPDLACDASLEAAGPCQCTSLRPPGSTGRPARVSCLQPLLRGRHVLEGSRGSQRQGRAGGEPGRGAGRDKSLGVAVPPCRVGREGLARPIIWVTH